MFRWLCSSMGPARRHLKSSRRAADHKRATLIGTQTFWQRLRADDHSDCQLDRGSGGDQVDDCALLHAKRSFDSGQGNRARSDGRGHAEGNFAGFNVREADLARHLENKNADKNAADKKRGRIRSQPFRRVNPMLPRTSSVPPKSNNAATSSAAQDFQLKQAMNHLKGLPVETAKARESVATAPAK